ncbi:MAG: methylthioribose-1-phosphate isomerase [Phycisphaerae bacterium SM23_30]|nr:MAG: methylthioribose-1-phosphate isomerase [Phycisphaerae bacterium SM23_30]
MLKRVNIKTIKWVGGMDGHVELIDQTLLPGEFRVIKIKDVETVRQAIKRLQVRGAPAIGIAAAFGAVLGLRRMADDAPVDKARQKLKETCDYLATSRPTAVNLFWALQRMQKVATESKIDNTRQLKDRLLVEAIDIRDEDAAMCQALGAHGADLISPGDGVLTHCNAGGLATAEYGTALGVMFAAHQRGKKFHVFVDETRPLLQGARLTTWELAQAGIDHTLICDNMAGALMQQGKINLVITGADRIAANGDAANKIGTYSLALLARAHNIPFYIAAPSSTFDLSIPDGSHIPIEERPPKEITHVGSNCIAPADVNVYNPAFDVTPHQYIAALITERGVIHSPDSENIRRLITNA